MKLKLALLLALCLPVMACKTVATTQPTAPAQGYLNADDQAAGEILAGAHSFYLSIQRQSAAGTLTLTPAVKSAFNTFGTSLNTADAIYLSYHNGTATIAQVQAATGVVKTQQAALPLPGATK